MIVVHSAPGHFSFNPKILSVKFLDMEIQQQQGDAPSTPRLIGSTSDVGDHVRKAKLESGSFPSMKLQPGVPLQSVSSEKKLTWVRSQIIGADTDFESPFGKRLVTYADHTASGRCLRYIEDFIINNVLPSYGKS